MQREIFLQQLLETAYHKEEVEVYDVAEKLLDEDKESFMQVREWTQSMVKEKLLTYTDCQNTTLKISSYGRYWMAHGGYMNYLREEHDLKEKRSLEKEAHQEKLLEARLKLTHYRLMGFWFALVVSALGFTLSIFNLFLFMSNK
jgi:hypothetical protein